MTEEHHEVPKSAGAYRRLQVERRRRDQARRLAEFNALRDRHGLRISSLAPKDLADQLKRLDMSRYAELDRRGLVIPCQARLLDGTAVNPCLLYPRAPDARNFIHAPKVLVGGQIASVLASEYTLPFPVIKAAWQAAEYRMGSYVPVLVAIAGERKYLVRAHSYFFRCGPYKGKDVDPRTVAEPSQDDYRFGRYIWGDSMDDEITVLAVDLS